MNKPAHTKEGSVLLIGGHENHDNGGQILDRFVELAGGTEAGLVVITAASEEPDQLWRVYKAALQRMGAKNCMGLHVRRRSEADYAAPVQAIDAAGGIFIAGGDQRRLLDCLQHSPLSDALLRALERGACVAGTSAGASALARHMLEQGENDIEPRKGAVRLSEGLGLLPGVVIDQHFSERQRLARLLSAIAEQPRLYGLGIDENTALLVRTAGEIEVLGAGGVTIVDGGELTSDEEETDDGGCLELIGVRMHVLPSGSHYRLREKPPPAIARLLRAMKGELENEDRKGT